MGTWGNNNFQDDASLNTLASLIISVVETIRETFKKNSEYQLFGGEGDSKIVANVDILETLYNHYRIYPDIEPREIVEWKQTYLKAYDEIFVDTPTDRNVIERRDIIEQTMDRLIVTITILREFFDSE